MPVQPEAFFLPAHSPSTGHRFCLFYPPAGDEDRPDCKGLVLYIHPFAEEMNKSRRMAALQARALSSAGFAVLQIDLLGCGDSSGDFGDASWGAWVRDVVQGCQWLRARSELTTPDTEHNRPPIWLWGLRAGCLVAVEAAKQLNEPCNFLFWQPPTSGKPLLQQFLRLKVAGDLASGQGKGVMEGLRQQLADGLTVEVAGYMLAPGLADGLGQAALTPLTRPAEGAGRLEWLEVSPREDADLNPVSIQTMDLWRQAGYRIGKQVATGSAFWQTLEIEDAPELVSATIVALSAARPAFA
jgi:uncharacterized protein